jgi:hypothetical protein
LKRIVLTTVLLLALAMAAIIAPAAYALDVPPVTMRFDMGVGGWSFKIGSASISWSSAHLNGTLSLSLSLATFTFYSGSTVTNLAAQGPINMTLSGTHTFTGIVRIHLDGSSPQVEITNFNVS